MGLGEELQPDAGGGCRLMEQKERNQVETVQKNCCLQQMCEWNGKKNKEFVSPASKKKNAHTSGPTLIQN